LFVWSRDRSEQKTIAASIVGGALPSDDQPYLAVLTQNFGGNKLDYYQRRAVRIERAGEGVIDVTVRLTNLTPDGLPNYMTVRSDKPNPLPPYGQSKVGFSVYGSRATEFLEVKVDGKPGHLAFDRDHGHRMGTMILELSRDAPVTVVIRMTQPSGVLVYRRQPLVVADVVDARLPIHEVGK
jgi:hypothetical protein